MRLTKQRKVILAALERDLNHPNADEVYTAVRQIIPRISLATVYRNLELLSEAGVIRKLTGSNQKRFDYNTQPHSHFRCMRCGHTEDVPFAAGGHDIPHGNRQWIEERKILGCNIEYYGFCASCKREA